MKVIMRVEDRFRTKENQLVASGVNPDFDELTSEEIAAIIGERVLVRRTDGSEMEVDVTGIDIPSSLLGKKNINIGLAIDDVEVGAVISPLAQPLPPNSVSN